MARKSKTPKRRRPPRETRSRIIWGLLAITSAGAVAYTGSTDTGKERLAELLEPRPTEVAQIDAPEAIARLSEEITRLRSETRRIALEKEALNLKITALEADFGPVTGSIPDVSDVELEAAEAELEPVEAPQAADALQEPEMPEPETAQPRTVRTIDVGYSPLPLSSEQADTKATIPEEDINAELAEAANPYARSLPTEVSRTRFAVQLGIGDTMDEVRDQWVRLSTEQDILVGPLEPAVAISEDGDKIRIRLLAGPFANAADAIQLCTVLTDRDVDCRAVRSEGQRLVMR